MYALASKASQVVRWKEFLTSPKLKNDTAVRITWINELVYILLLTYFVFLKYTYAVVKIIGITLWAFFQEGSIFLLAYLKLKSYTNSSNGTEVKLRIRTLQVWIIKLTPNYASTTYFAGKWNSYGLNTYEYIGIVRPWRLSIDIRE